MNRSKAPLALMGQLLMVLFFALTAAICLQAFTKSESISKASAHRDAASLLAQNAAETIKSVHGDLEELCARLGGQTDGTSWQGQGDENGLFSETGSYRVRAERMDSESPGLGKAQILVFDTAEKELVSLICSWQEAMG